MKLTMVLLIATCIQVSAAGYSQKVTIKESNIPLQKVFDEIKKQTNYHFLYADDVLKTTHKVSLDIEKGSIEDVLDVCFKNQQLGYIISGNTVIVKRIALTSKVNISLASTNPLYSPVFTKAGKEFIDVDEIRGKLINAIQIKGKVANSDGEPLIGVSVTVKGTSIGTSTDSRGMYDITASDGNGILVFSYVGFASREIPINDRSRIDITLEANISSMEQVVIVGYGTQKKESVVGAIAHVSGEDLQQRGGVSNFSSALAGQIPGVTVIESNGEPGRDDPDILIRGMSTWNGAKPLILVDGVERLMNDVNVNDVETVSVLKDASATAVFGVKGANGVILITTKRGSLGKPKLSFSVHQLAKSVSKIPKLMEAYSAQKWRDVGVERDVNWSPSAWQYYIPDEVVAFSRKPQVEPYSYLYPNVDWQKAMLKNFATSSQFDMNVSGGTNNVKYFASLGYVHDGDILNSHYNKKKGYDPGFSYDRFNFRSNLDFQLTKTTLFSANLNGYIGAQKSSNANGGHTGDGPGINGSPLYHLYSGLYELAPDAFPIQYPDGNYGINAANLVYSNPIVGLQESGYLNYNRFHAGTDLKLDQKLDVITKGLSVSARISFDNYVTSFGPSIYDAGLGSLGTAISEYRSPSILQATNRADSLKAIQLYAAGNVGAKVNEFDIVLPPWTKTNEAVTPSSLQRNLYYQASINYSRSFDKHTVSGLALFDRRQTAQGSEFSHFQEDWVGRLTYNFDSRYFAEFNGAYNGSEKFAPKYRFGFFPSAALGWMISNERFMQQLSWLDNLKLRGSLGAVGSDQGIPRWSYIGSWLLPGSASYFYGEDGIAIQTSPYLTYREGVIANPEIRWETAVKSNIGIDFSAFQNKITFTGDVFHDRRKNIFMSASQRNIPVTFGAPPVPANLGETETNGYEMTLGYNKRSVGNGFGFNVSLSMTKAIDKIIKYEDPKLLPDYQKTSDFQIGQTRSTIKSGPMNTWDDVYGSVRGTSDMQFRAPGDWDLIDYNGDGIVDNFDVIPYGFPTRPQNSYNATLGAKYKNLSLMVQFFAVTNVNLRASVYAAYASPWNTVSESLGDYWTPDNPNAFYKAPRLTTGSPGGQFGLYDASYLRLKTAVLAYDFTGKWVKDLGVSGARVALTGNNLLFWSDMPNDTETNYNTDNAYPTFRQFDLSLNVTF